MMPVGIANPWWRGKCSRHSWRRHNPQFYISGKLPMDDEINLELLYCIDFTYNPCIQWKYHINIFPQEIQPRAHFTNIFFPSYCKLNENFILLSSTFKWNDHYKILHICAKFCSDLIARNVITSKWIFHWIWIIMDKFVSEMGLKVMCMMTTCMYLVWWLLRTTQ